MNSNKKLFVFCIYLSIAAYDKKLRDIPFKKEKTQGFMGKDNNNDRVYIAFRGTTCEDMMQNLFIFLKKIPFGNGPEEAMAHSKFIPAYFCVRDKIMRFIKQNPASEIIITGHSLGGALATLCAYDVANNFKDSAIKCVTFASPRVGNKKFAKTFNKRFKKKYIMETCKSL